MPIRASSWCQPGGTESSHRNRSSAAAASIAPNRAISRRVDTLFVSQAPLAEFSTMRHRPGPARVGFQVTSFAAFSQHARWLLRRPSGNDVYRRCLKRGDDLLAHVQAEAAGRLLSNEGDARDEIGRA